MFMLVYVMFMLLHFQIHVSIWLDFMFMLMYRFMFMLMFSCIFGVKGLSLQWSASNLKHQVAPGSGLSGLDENHQTLTRTWQTPSLVRAVCDSKIYSYGYGHLLVITGYFYGIKKIYKWGFLSTMLLITGITRALTVPSSKLTESNLKSSLKSDSSPRVQLAPCVIVDTRWCPPKWFLLAYNPINYRYIYHKS